MTLSELSIEYRQHAQTIATRVNQLERQRSSCADVRERTRLEGRIRTLSTMVREARELAVLTERYYERGYRPNGKYTV